MPITSLPALVDSDLGRPKAELPAIDPNRDYSSAEIERWKRWLVALGAEVGLSDGSTAGSLREAVTAAVANVDTANVSATGTLVAATSGITAASKPGAGYYEILADGLVEGQFGVQLTVNDDGADGPVMAHWLTLGDGTGISVTTQASGSAVSAAFTITIFRGLSGL